MVSYDKSSVAEMGNPPKRAVTNAKWPTFEKYCVGKAGNPSMSMRKKSTQKVNLEVNLKSKLTFLPFFAPPLM